MTDHRWTFFRAGGFDQVRIDTGADIAALDALDPKLWVAIACPVEGLELDRRTLGFLDADGDGRVRAPEVIAAARWTCERLASPDELRESRDALPLASISTRDEAGRRILASAKKILEALGRPDGTSLSPADTADTATIFGRTRFNGDGVISVESAEGDEATAAVLRDVLACVDATKDRGGAPGVDRARVSTFFDDARAYAAWGDEATKDASLLPLGDATAAACGALDAIAPKVDDFFTRAALAAMDPALTAALRASSDDVAALASASLGEGHAALAALPVARVEAGRALPLREGVNPAHAAAIEALRTACVEPLLGARDALTAADWAALRAKLAAHRAWKAKAPTSRVTSLGLPRVRALLAGSAQADLEALLARDEALAPEAEALGEVDRLVHYYVHLARFLDNFVAFRDFYQRRGKAGFQAGTLYLDGRSFELCVRVANVDAHAALAEKSMACLVYCRCTRKSGETRTIAAAVTNGDSDFLAVGRNGLFYDRDGGDWDATVIKIVEQPISVRQAFFTPYKTVARFVATQIETFVGSRSQAVDAALAGGVTSTAAAAAAPAPAAPSPAPGLPFDLGRSAGIFAAVSLALGAIGTAMAAGVTAFLGLPIWQMPFVIAAALLVISGPSMLLAAMKLRRRTLGPILDAAGWAINARARINIPFGESLTKLAALPEGAERGAIDPYAERASPWRSVLVVALVIAVALWVLNETGVLAGWIAGLTHR